MIWALSPVTWRPKRPSSALGPDLILDPRALPSGSWRHHHGPHRVRVCLVALDCRHASSTERTTIRRKPPAGPAVSESEAPVSGSFRVVQDHRSGQLATHSTSADGAQPPGGFVFESFIWYSPGIGVRGASLIDPRGRSKSELQDPRPNESISCPAGAAGVQAWPWLLRGRTTFTTAFGEMRC